MAPGEVTLLLADLRRGDQAALGKLMPLVYGELRRLAGHYMRGERAGHTLQPTAVVHEAYLRLAGQDWAEWNDREHFIGVAARQMRRTLVDYAGRHIAEKRGGAPAKIDLDALSSGFDESKSAEILSVDEALERLRRLDSRQAEVLELRYFGGLTVEEAAVQLGVSPRTVKRDWSVGVLWLRAELAEGSKP